MKVLNIHSREYQASPKEIGAFIDSLSSVNDLLWPHHIWPQMLLDKPLSLDAAGGHGPIRYYVEKYEAGKKVQFQFTGPNGFIGFHSYEAVEKENGRTVLCETLKMKARGLARLSWPLIFRPLHDALMEDSLTCAEIRLGIEPSITKWTWWVKCLRWVLSGGKASKQHFASVHGRRKKEDAT